MDKSLSIGTDESGKLIYPSEVYERIEAMFGEDSMIDLAQKLCHSLRIGYWIVVGTGYRIRDLNTSRSKFIRYTRYYTLSDVSYNPNAYYINLVNHDKQRTTKNQTQAGVLGDGGISMGTDGSA